ncbi:putative phosphatidate phosphatase [Drosophila guanche]|uniref:Blast:Putative phosphatidate phosphatase n=1 Tax=Drosophila guanche TaxID=7266 RepID=A0A3B0JUD6_DROGU|nr:putative phosphatidate phosphatase [Drosophila guanche]SPP76341.1 blast:Putative phosphatidate phosphatase [Drosophila guanche]
MNSSEAKLLRIDNERSLSAMRTFKRGFFCSDLTIRYPYHECTITVPMLLLMKLLLPMLLISVVEIMRICKRFRMRLYLRNLWRSQATFSFGFIATFLTTELAKNVVGRLRPHFYQACQPRLNDGTSCSDPQNADLYVEQFYCSNRNISARQIRELHVSFPSAHSSLSFYSMCLLAFYVHSVWQGRGSIRVLRHILQFLMLMAALCVSLSRVADYWHHWSDVLAGAVLGVVYAAITAIYVGDMLRPQRPRAGVPCPTALGYSSGCHHHHLHQLMAENNNSSTSTKVHFLAAAASATMTTTTPLDDIHNSNSNSNSNSDIDDNDGEDDDDDVYKPPTSRTSTTPSPSALDLPNVA